MRRLLELSQATRDGVTVTVTVIMIRVRVRSRMGSRV